MQRGGTLDGVRLVSPRSVELMTTNQVGTRYSAEGNGWGLAFATAPTTVVHVDIDGVHEATGLFNPFVGSTLTWDLGHGWGFTYLLGAYIDIDSSVAYSSSSLNQRFGLSYTANEWNLTANVIWGINFDQTTTDPQGFPCPTAPAFGCNPNFLNVDLTAT